MFRPRPCVRRDDSPPPTRPSARPAHRRAALAVAGLAAAVAAGLTGAVVPTVSAQAAAAPPSTVNLKLAPTPPMGFNDWNAFGCDVDAQLIEQTADFFVSSGLKDAGYTYVNIDDCWQLKSRNKAGHLVPDPAKFPKGIKGTAAYVHSKGLKLGIYEDAGTLTCAGYPGSLGHEQTDANDFAKWGVDYLKYDNCSNQSDGSLADYQKRYADMGAALNRTGRSIVYSICEWGVNNPGAWAGRYGNLWRTTGDINDSWGSLKSIIEQNAPLAQYAKPGNWNDPDMLEVGNGGMTDTEYRTHFSLWAEMAAPLLIGTDLRTASAATMAIYKNSDVIAIDQDRLGVQGQVIAQRDGTMVFSKPLANGDRAIALYNSTDSAQTISTTTAQAGLARTTAYRVKDLWSKAVSETAGTVGARVPAHGTVLLRVSPAAGTWSNVAPHTLLTVDSSTSDPSLPVAAAPGSTLAVSSSITDYGRAPLSDVRVTADAPDGWTISAAGPVSRRSLGSGRSLETPWKLTVPSDAKSGAYRVVVTTSYRWGDRGRLASASAPLTVQVATLPPAGTNAVSSLTWVSAQNYWGPVEKNTSNGESGAGDGKPITIRGTVYPKGLGVHAPSTVTYFLGGRCTAFASTVGIDDEVVGSGTGNGVEFEVLADGNTAATSGVVTSTSTAKSLTADVTGAQWLQLVVDDNGNTNYDHADWANPTLTCTAAG